METMKHTSHFAKDFSKAQRTALTRKGIAIIGAMVIPAATGELRFSNGERGYQLNDNGTHRVRSYAEVVALAS